MEPDTNQSGAVDPIAFTKDHMAKIGEVWKTYALNKRSEAMSRVEGSLDRAPAALKKWLKLSSEDTPEGGETQAAPGNGAEPPRATEAQA